MDPSGHFATIQRARGSAKGEGLNSAELSRADAPRFEHDTAVHVQLRKCKQRAACTVPHTFKIVKPYEEVRALEMCVTGRNVTSSRRAGSEAEQDHREKAKQI